MTDKFKLGDDVVSNTGYFGKVVGYKYMLFDRKLVIVKLGNSHTSGMEMPFHEDDLSKKTQLIIRNVLKLDMDQMCDIIETHLQKEVGDVEDINIMVEMHDDKEPQVGMVVIFKN